MTIGEIQAAIDAKADARQIINMIADYIEANPGGGGGGLTTANSGLNKFGLSTIRLGGGGAFGSNNPLLDDTILNVNGWTFYVYNGNKQLFEINPTGGSFRFGDISKDGNGMQVSIQDDQSFVEVGNPLGVAGNNTKIRISDDLKTIAFNADNGYNFVGVPVFADNAAAVTGGLGVGTHYRTGDNLKIVH